MINVIGLGYIGLPTALMFAKSGIKVVGTDYNEELINTLLTGQLTFEENGLGVLLKNAKKNGIDFSTKYQKTNLYIIAVPTPYINSSKKIDPTYVLSALRSILDVCEKDTIIVLESTVSPGFIDRYVRPEVTNRGFEIGKDIHLVHAPERIIPGNMIYELENNSRTVGCDNLLIGGKIKELYSSFCKAEIIITSIKIAEMSKVIENTYRDINIAFANELAKICYADDLDVYEVIDIANKHPRVNILQPGPGVGGHCISVDPWFLVGDYPDLTNLILTARKTNDSMPSFVLERVHKIMKEKNISDPMRVGLYGLTYKENVDDVRESPTLQLLEIMEKHLAAPMKTYDPYVKDGITKNQAFDLDEFLNDLDLIVVMVAHEEILNNAEKLKNKIVFDTRNKIKLPGTIRL